MTVPRRIALLVAIAVASHSVVLSGSARAQSSVGIYSDVSGNDCTLSDLSPGTLHAYVVVRPAAGGATGLQFAAPPPACFTGVYVGEQAAPGTLVIGDSQTGISVALLGCVGTSPTHVLTIQYTTFGTTPTCCAYPVIPDPAVSDILVVDCAFVERPAVSAPSTINADATCPCTGNSPPGPPSNPGPADGALAVSVKQMLTWYAWDSDGNLAEFDVYLGTDPSPPLAAAALPSPSYQPAPMAPFTQYYWRVVARDAGGLETSGDVWTFTTRAVNTPPGAPVVVTPRDGETDVMTNPELVWVAVDIDGDTLVHDAYFGTTPTPPLVASELLTSSYLPGSLAYGTTYYWRVVSRDAADAETSGPVWSFLTRPSNYPPNAPSNPQPPDGSLNRPLNTALDWTGGDRDGDPLVYDVYFGTTPTPPLVASELLTSFYLPGSLAYGTTYYWRVVSRDAPGGVTAGPVWSFATKANSAPLAPSAPNPMNNGSAFLAPQLTWVASDPDGTAPVYDVYFGDQSPPPLAASGLIVAGYSPGTLQALQTYYWRVVASDGQASTSGPTWSFLAVLPGDIDQDGQLTVADADCALDDYLSNVYCGGSRGEFAVTGVDCNAQATPRDARCIHKKVVDGSCTFCVPDPVTSAAPDHASSPGTVGIYHDETGTGCGLIDAGPGFLNAYVVVHPDANGATGLQFAAPMPACFTGVYLGDQDAPGTLVIGNSQVGVSVSLLGCKRSPTHALTIQYSTFGTTPDCCLYPVVNDPAVSDIIVVGCDFVERPGSSVLNAINPTAMCCTNNNPPSSPSNPFPADGASGVSIFHPLSWSAGDVDGNLAEFDVYFGAEPSPPLVASGVSSQVYNPGRMNLATLYYWRILARDDYGFEAWGPTWRFTTSSNLTPSISIADAMEIADTLLVTLNVAGVPSLEAFGFDIEGDTGVQIIGVSPAPATSAFAALATSGGRNGRVGGYSLTGAPADAETAFLNLRFIIPDGEISIYAHNFVDDLAGAAGLRIVWDGTLLPVLISRFEALLAGAGIELVWELGGDETAERFTLLRREGAGAYPVVVAEGPVTAPTGSYHDVGVEPGTTYHYELVVRTHNGDEFHSPVATVSVPVSTLTLGQNHPNPFNPQTAIPYTLPGGAAPVHVRLSIHDVAGKVVRTLVDEPQTGGAHEAVWDGRDERGGAVSSGVYFYVLDADGQRRTRKLVLLK